MSYLPLVDPLVRMAPPDSQAGSLIWSSFQNHVPKLKAKTQAGGILNVF